MKKKKKKKKKKEDETNHLEEFRLSRFLVSIFGDSWRVSNDTFVGCTVYTE